MAEEKVMTYVRADRELLDEFRAVAEKQGWPFQAAIEIAMRRFVLTYCQLDLPNLYLVKSTSDEMVENGAAEMPGLEVA